MGLIYVNPEGPNGNPDPVASGRDVRETFARMAMNDEETVALVAGGHTFGKCHGAGPMRARGPRARGAPHRGAGPRLEEQLRQRQGRRHDHQRHRGRLEAEPDPVGHGLPEGAVRYEWELVKSPAGANQWLAKDVAEEDMVADAHDPSKKHRPMMTTADLSLRFDPIYEPIARRFLENPEEFADAFARAWFKLTHRDMGPRSRYLGPEVPAEELIWQDPVPAVDHELIDAQDIAALKGKILASGLSVSGAGLDRLGVGVHLPRLRQARRRERRAHPPRAAEGLGGQPAGAAGEGAEDPRRHPEGVQRAQSGGKKVSLADLIVLGGCAASSRRRRTPGTT
jgi:catalase-peroxidase